MPRRNWNRGEKIAAFSAFITVISCAAAVIVVPEVRQVLRLNWADSTKNAEASFSISGNNNTIRIDSGWTSDVQNVYTFGGNNTEATTTLATGTVISLKIEGVNNSILVSTKIAIQSVTDGGANNSVTRFK